MTTAAFFEYDKMIDKAMRGVMREALTQAAKSGLPSDHHFYISFATRAKGVAIPELLRQRFPDEMTIVLQHQFWDLTVQPECFSLTLSFSGKHEHLTIPFDAVTSFADPFARFGLQFQSNGDTSGQAAEASGPQADAGAPKPDAAKHKPLASASEKIVTLDAFRRK